MKHTSKLHPQWIDPKTFITDKVFLNPDQRNAFVAKLPRGAYARAGEILNLCRSTPFQNMLLKKRNWYVKATIETLQSIIASNPQNARKT